MGHPVYYVLFQKRKGEGDNAAGPATENRGGQNRTTELSNMAAAIASDRQIVTAETAADNNGDHGGDFRNVQGGVGFERIKGVLESHVKYKLGCVI